MKRHRAPAETTSVSGATDSPLRELLARTIEQLDARWIADEALGVMRPAHRILGVMRPAVIVPSGRAWRLGVLLLDRECRLYATGRVTRAVMPKRGVADHSLIADARREEQRAAVRGSFTEGEVVNFGYSPIPIDEDSLLAGAGPLSMETATITVKWDSSGAGRGSGPLEAYLTERISLLSLD
jgi:hypothetical protein